jgi:hypothetical protein
MLRMKKVNIINVRVDPVGQSNTLYFCAMSEGVINSTNMPFRLVVFGETGLASMASMASMASQLVIN